MSSWNLKIWICIKKSLISISQPTPPSSTSPTILVMSPTLFYSHLKTNMILPFVNYEFSLGFENHKIFLVNAMLLGNQVLLTFFVLDVKSIKMSRNYYRHYFLQFRNNTSIVFYWHGADKRYIYIFSRQQHTRKEKQSLKMPLHRWKRAQLSKPEHTWLPWLSCGGDRTNVK